MRVIQLSDLHLTASGRDEDGVDARGALTRMLADLRHVTGVDLVVVSGDVADDGSLGGYRAAAQLVGGFAARHRAPVVYCAGNHDDRANFAAVLGTGHRDGAGTEAGSPSPDSGRRAAVSHVGGLRVVTLDSLVPGCTHGGLDDAQLTWLRDVLATPASLGTLVVLHHPPIAVPGHPLHATGLQDPAGLADAVAGTDVVAVLCGHCHHQMSGQLAGVPVWVSPGVVTRIDTTAPEHLMRGVLGAGATVIDLGDGPPVFRTLQARDPHAGQPVYLVDALTFAEVPDEEAVPG